jgi:WD40 repeat protein
MSLPSIWDLRKLVGMPDDASEDQIASCMVASYPHGKAVSSAYWHPSGTKLLSSAYDDALRIWDVDPFKVGGLAKKFEPSVVIKACSHFDEAR